MKQFLDGLLDWYPMDFLGVSTLTISFLLISPELSKPRHAKSQNWLRGCSFGANRPLFSAGLSPKCSFKSYPWFLWVKAIQNLFCGDEHPYII